MKSLMACLMTAFLLLSSCWKWCCRCAMTVRVVTTLKSAVCR